MFQINRKLELFLGLSLLAFMIVGLIFSETNAQTVPTKVKGPYPGTVSADALDFQFIAGRVDSTTFFSTGNELLLVHNTAADATYYITIKSVPDEYGRTGDITEYDVGPDEYAAFKFTSTAGWRNETLGGVIEFVVENAAVEYAVLNIGR